jgi:glycerol-3-phosphate acyltransferase PlsY
MMLAILIPIVLFIIAYLSGSVCSAVLVCRFFDLPDPRTEGSQNPGATNVLRLAGKKYAMMVLFVDMLKGYLPLLLAQCFDVSLLTLSFTCFAAVIGHMYPVFFEFKGGKGVATTLGAMFGLHFMLGVFFLGTWMIVAYVTRYSSLASLVSVVLAPIYVVAMTHNFDAFPALFFIAVFVLYKHNENISRLIEGRENKMVLKSAATEPK